MYMKRILLLTVVALLITIGAKAQVFKGMVIGGFNLTQVDGDEVYGFDRIGANIGAGVFVPIDNNWGLSMETLFTMKGSYQGDQYLLSDSLGNRLTGSYDLRLNYVEIPLLIHYNDRDRITVGVGFSYARLVGVTEKEHGVEITSTTVKDGPYKTSDYSLLADVRLRIYKSLLLNVRYCYSLAKIRTRDFYNVDGVYLRTREQYNNTISVRFIWMFNDLGLTLSNVKKANPTLEK
ncbi:MAG: hypothetical protein CVU06_12475 [Bacteroidetes bacterium HGW-Bacteroidetes-22]|nr:MAG: hypothetical protein CVU06_12475 [Bacteroidetes bacterium HGW-Bacteroidetes-22]